MAYLIKLKDKDSYWSKNLNDNTAFFSPKEKLNKYQKIAKFDSLGDVRNVIANIVDQLGNKAGNIEIVKENNQRRTETSIERKQL